MCFICLPSISIVMTSSTARILTAIAMKALLITLDNLLITNRYNDTNYNTKNIVKTTVTCDFIRVETLMLSHMQYFHWNNGSWGSLGTKISLHHSLTPNHKSPLPWSNCRCLVSPFRAKWNQISTENGTFFHKKFQIITYFQSNFITKILSAVIE